MSIYKKNLLNKHTEVLAAVSAYLRGCKPGTVQSRGCLSGPNLTLKNREVPGEPGPSSMLEAWNNNPVGLLSAKELAGAPG